MSKAQNFTVSPNLFSSGKYLAFVLDESTRQALITAIGARLPIRVCHHITIHYDVPKDALEVEILQEYVNAHRQFHARGFMVTNEQVVIRVCNQENYAGRPIIDNKERALCSLHITFERNKSVQDKESKKLFTGRYPYTFNPLNIPLNGEFQMMTKNGHTPTEDGLIEEYKFSSSAFAGDNEWIAVQVSPLGFPASFLHRNKNGPSRTVERDLSVGSEYLRIFDAWQDWGFRATSKGKRRTRLVNPPPGQEISEYASLCSEIALPVVEDTRCVVGQPKNRSDYLDRPKRRYTVI